MNYPHPGLDVEKIALNRARIGSVEVAMADSRPLRLVTACSYCDQVRIVDDRLEPKWISREAYGRGSEHCHDQVTHGICPHCYENIVQPVLARLRRNVAFGTVVPIAIE